MKGLLLAEKPSVMREIEKVYKKEQNYPYHLDFGAFHGHLMALKTPEQYNPAWADRKDMSILPMIPQTFEYISDDEKSVNALLEKIKDGHYDFLVNACDAGREGEHIFWSFYEANGLTLPVKRFWASSVTSGGIKKALNDLKDPALYDGMRQAAKFRANFDWLIGMNLTRAATKQLGGFVSIGRVQTPTLKLIVDREKELRDFVPKDFYELKGTFTIGSSDVQAVYLLPPDCRNTRFDEQSEAKKTKAAVDRIGAGTVKLADQQVKVTDAPTLYSLAELQKAANRFFKFKADKTLAIAQKLYEDGLLTYPRTESRYLPTDMIPEIPAHLAPITAVPELESYAKTIGQPEIQAMLKKKYVDDAGITDHHAIIPTDQIPKFASLTKDEQAVYTLVCKSFLAIFMPPQQVSASTILIDIGGHTFKATGKSIIDKGYTVLYPEKKKSKDATLPVCKQGDAVKLVKSIVSKGATTPPKRYTPETLVTAMQNAGQDLPDKTMRQILRESAGLGTSATRADILNKLEDRQYVEMKANAYYATELGIFIIDHLGERSFCSPMLTAEWEEKLMQMEGKKYTGDFRKEMEEYICAETKYLLDYKQDHFTTVGSCPFCGGEVRERAKAYACDNFKKSCNMCIPKQCSGHIFTKADIKRILSGGKTEVYDLESKAGKKFRASFAADKERGVDFVFENSEPRKVIGQCPVCHGKVYTTAKACICENHKQGESSSCDFYIPKIIGGYTLDESELITLLAGKQTESHIIKTKSGDDWKVRFAVKDGKLTIINDSPREVVGICPVCGGKVYAAGKAYMCENNKRDELDACGFYIPKTIGGYTLDKSDIDALLGGKQTEKHKIKTKAGKDWEIRFEIKNGKLEFIDDTPKTPAMVVGKCPVCGKDVLSGKSYYCSGFQDKTCNWTMGRSIKGAAITDKDIQTMLNGNLTAIKTFIWSSQKTGRARIGLDNNGKLIWKFEN